MIGDSGGLAAVPQKAGTAIDFAAGVLFAAGWALGEGVFQLWARRDLGIGQMLLAIGATAPLWPLVGLATLVIHSGWQRILHAPRPAALVLDTLRLWLAPASPPDTARRAAWTIAALATLVLWAMASIHLGARIAREVRTPAFVATAILAVSGALAMVAAMALPTLSVFVRSAIEALIQRRPGTVRWATPAVIVGATISVAAACLGWLWVFRREIMIHLPWALVAGLTGGLAFAFGLTGRVLRRSSSHRSVVALIAIAGLFSWAGRSPHAPRSIFMGTPSLTAASFHLFGPSLAQGAEWDEDDGQNAHIEPARPDWLAPLPPAVNQRPHILLVTTDSLSFGHTTLGGYHRDTTPRLAEWARRAAVFPTAFSLSAATRTAFPGLLAGIFNAQAPLQEGRAPPFPYAQDMPTMAALLKARGYRTVHIPGDRFFLEGGRGWHSVGFDTVDDVCLEARDPIHTAPELTDAAIRYVNAQPAGEPLFLWVHYFDHHIPFQLSGEVVPFGDAREKVDIYDAELRFADRHWGRLLEHVERVWSPAQYLAIFTSDHGESFDANHPLKHHSGSILTSVLHVPLVIQAPQARGTTIDGLVSHADILPTVANIVGIERDDAWVGSSLAPALFGEAATLATVQYSLRFAPEAHRSKQGGYLEIGVRTRDHYLMFDLIQGTTKLVDWRRDSLERNDLSAVHPEEHARLRRLALRKLAWIKARECGLRYPACPRPK